jgi:predicted O-methyltransferase YrrM
VKGEKMAKQNKISQPIMNIKDIEQYIIDAGSDCLEVFGGKFEGGVNVQQIPDELAPCILAIIESGQIIKSYLEIGVAAGGLTSIMNHFFQPVNIVLVDDGLHHKAKYRTEILQEIKREEIIGDVHDAEVVKQAAGSYDIIILDADLSYEGTAKEIFNYVPMLNPGGFLMFHDSVYSTDVARVVKELKQNEDFEFIGEYVSAKQKPCGVALFKRK